MNRARFAAVLAVMLSLGAFGMAVSAAAADGLWTRHRLPQTTRQIDGFTCDMRMIDPDGFGYMPLRLEATSTTGRFPADRRITVSLIPRQGANWPQPQTSYRVDFELPEGQSTATAEYYLPKYFAGASFEIAMSESGRRLEGYSLLHSAGSSNGGPMAIDAQERLTKFAVILPDRGPATGAAGERVPDMRSIESMNLPNIPFLQMSDPSRLDDADALDHLRLRSVQSRQILHESQAHSVWLGYESVDVVIVSFAVLERMRDADPQRFEAIREWVACGGAVWSYGVEDRESLAALFGTPPLAAGDPGMASGILIAVGSFDPALVVPRFDWNLGRMRGHIWTDDEIQYLNEDPAARWAAMVSSRHPIAATATTTELEQALIVQPVMAGIVVGLKDPDPFPGAFQLWHTVRHLTASRQVWPQKHGTPMFSGTDNFWNWSLENVARPPVYAFLGVLTGFVLLVGPVSYHLTRRGGRTYLMFFIAPLLATCATLLLFGYGMLADGLGTQVRVRQITWADGPAGRAARMTRATYFAGFRPQEGLKFPSDSAVYPIIDKEEGQARVNGPRPSLTRSVILGERHQQFAGDFLPARRQRQFVATRPIDSGGAVSLLSSPGQAPRVRNDFDLEVSRLVVRDSRGDYYTTTGPLAAGGELDIDPVNSVQAFSLLQKLYKFETPAPPLGYSPGGRSGFFGGGHLYRSRIQSQPSYAHSWYDPYAEFGVFESRLRMMLQDRGEIPPGWFVGHAELSDDAIAIDGAEPVSSVHFVMGVLR